jgi:hypothetical protein
MDSVMNLEKVLGKEEVVFTSLEEEEVISASETNDDELEPNNWDYDIELHHIFLAIEDETDIEEGSNPIGGGLVQQVFELLQNWKKTITTLGNAPTDLALTLEDLGAKYTGKDGNLRDGLTLNDLEGTDATRLID